MRLRQSPQLSREALEALEHLKGAAGRLEKAGTTAQGVPVFVDYAHKPEALENVLAAVRPFTTGRVIVVFGCVFGGFILSGGQLMALVHPFEVLIIGGAALGAFLQANPGSMFMTVFKKSLSMFGSRFTHTYYLEVLKLLYEILNKSRREGMMAIEADVEDPNASPIFSKYPAVLKDARMTAFICDYLRIMSSGNMAPHELEGLFDMELASLKEEVEHPAHAVAKVADGISKKVVILVITLLVFINYIYFDNFFKGVIKISRHGHVNFAHPSP